MKAFAKHSVKPIMAALLATSALLTGCGTIRPKTADAPREKTVRNFSAAAPQEKTSQQLASECMAATVSIEISDAQGSGWPIDDHGDIMTADHVIVSDDVPADPSQKNDKHGHKRPKPRDKVTVIMPGGKRYPAKIMFESAAKDIAILHINIKGNKYLEFGDSDKAVPGDTVIQCGNPFNLGVIATKGMVSSAISHEDGIDFLRYDASVNPGTSGGPVLDIKGKVIGLADQIVSKVGQYAGLSYAVSSNEILRTIPPAFRPKAKGGAYAPANTITAKPR